MRDYMLLLVIRMLLTILVEDGTLLVLKWRVGPLPLGFEEECKGVRTDVDGIGYSVLNT